MPRTPPSSSLTEAAYERLRADLLACRLPPGARLRINDLCRSLSVSLGAVREALSRLTAEGLVVAEPQRGFRAKPISAADLRDITEVRIRIECLCLERALDRGDAGFDAHLVACFERLSGLPEREGRDPARLSDAWSIAHAEFHRAMVAACDSPWLLRLRDMLYAQSERYRRLSVPLAEIARDLPKEHAALLDAALKRDVRRAARLLTRHLETTTRILLEQDWVRPDAAAPIVADGRGNRADDVSPRPGRRSGRRCGAEAA